jgi:hypothetical protein
MSPIPGSAYFFLFYLLHRSISFSNLRVKAFFTLILLVMAVPAYAASTPVNPADTASLADNIRAKVDEVLRQGKTTDRLTENDLANLPIGIGKEIGGKKYFIIVDSVRFTPETAYLNAYAVLGITGTNKELAFAATNIEFQPGGLSTSMSTKLHLVSSETIPFGSNIDLVLASDGSNYVEFDCNGFKSVNVKGIFEFDRKILLPADENIDKVRATVEGNFTDFDNILASIKITPFRPKKFAEMVIEVEEAFVDLNNMANPAALIFPPDYYGPSNPAFWRGFFIKRAKVTLPEKLSSGKGDIRIEAQNLIIDKKGFSGMVGAANIFDTDEGNLNGWPFSIDSIGVHIIKNQLVGAQFKGSMVVPPFDKGSPLKYSALIQTSLTDQSSYLFYLEPTKTLKASALMADVELMEGSSIVVKEVGGKLQPEAMLNGYLSVKSGSKLAVNRLRFESLHLASEKPYIRSGAWSMTGEGEQKMGGFPIAIHNVKMEHVNDQLKLSLDVMLNLMNEDDKGGFAASTSVAVEGEMVEEVQQQGEKSIYIRQWQHKGTYISAATIDYQSKAFGLKGAIQFFESHSTMGNGFRGEIDARFGDQINVKAVGQFGKVDDFKYWYVDAMAKFPNGIGSGLSVYGMGGGMYYHMKIKEVPRNDFSEFTTVQGDIDEVLIGKSRSATEYMPDREMGLGFKASVVVGIQGKPKLFNGAATLEMAFYDRGGINFIRFIGEGYFMKGLNEPADKNQMYAALNINLDLENDELHGELKTYINAGRNVIQGSHERGLAGTAVLHVDNTDWYIHIGTPNRRISVNIMGVAEVGAYFMAGTYIHDFPSVTDVIPDSELVASIEGDLDGFMRDESALSSGGGLAFGASLNLNTGKKTFLIFYGQFDAGLGFDVMLRDYGGAYCAGSTEPVGINGWYASGQAWLYLQGDIGISVQLKFVQGDFVIMQVGMASVVQAKLPNPTFIQGHIAGNYNILGGLVKGDFNFKVSIGDECDIVGSSDLGVKVIAELQPAGSEKVDVFTAPQVAFNVPVDKVFELYDETSDRSKAYKVKLDHFKVLKGGEEIAGDIEMNEEKKVAVFNSIEILPPESELETEVKVSWHERVNGSWEAMGTENNKEVEEKKVAFTTGEAPDYIPESNVKYSYPVTGMNHFYPEEHSKGYMVLKDGQAYLFEDRENFTFEARIVPVGSLIGKSVALNYDISSRSITYDIPDQLQLSEAFNIFFVKKPRNVYQVDANVTQVEETLEASADATIILETQEIEGSLILEEEEVLYGSFFATGKYRTFTDKINGLGDPVPIASFLPAWNVSRLGLLVNPQEAFDVLEMEGKGEIEPLVQFEAQTDNPWYADKIYPLNYRDYPVNNQMLLRWREKDPFGIPPLKAISIRQDNNLPLMTQEQLYTSRITNNNGDVIFFYDLAFISLQDFIELQKKAFMLYGNNISAAPPGALSLMRGSFSGYTMGIYKFRVFYKLPGRPTRTTEKIYTITNQ